MSKLVTFTIVIAICAGCVFFVARLNAAKNDSALLLEKPMKINAWLDANNKIDVKFSEELNVKDTVAKNFILTDKRNKNIPIKSIVSSEINKIKSSLFNLLTDESLKVNHLYLLKYLNEEPVQIMPRKVLDSDEYYYQGDDLGSTYSKENTGFKLWAPTAVDVKVLIYDNFSSNLDFNISEVSMERADNGIWFGIADGDFNGKYYLYKIDLYQNSKLKTNFVNDPYTKASGVDCLKTYIFDPNDINTAVIDWDKDSYVKLENKVDAVLYELHIRDYTIDKSSGIKSDLKGKYLGLVEEGLKSPEGMKSGIDNIIELGVTHVHLLPTYDYGTGDEAERNDLYTWYNWGYDPVLYFNVEGSYSTYPDGINRLIEYKKMVKGFHDKNIGVVQDIVFNHTLSTGDDKFSIFDKIVPMYFYRVYDDGKYANGSYCGNEVATERPMVRKYIIDNLTYYAKEFHIDGFRFDLMGLMDKKTLVDAYKAVREINPDTIFYGEGWNMGDVLPVEEKMIQKNVAGTGVAAFNDGIRDNLKGDVFDEHAKGFVQNAAPMTGMTRLKLQIKAQDTGRDKEPIPVVDPNESVNYVSCHDNHTIWDKLKISNPKASFEELKKMDLLAFSFVITSQGIPFFGEGDEFGRTKRGVENSYNDNDPTVNPINWSLKSSNSDMFEFYKGMIQLRKEHPAFRMTSKDMINKNMKFIDGTPDNIIAYTLNNNANGDSWKTILVAFNSGRENYKLNLKGKWHIVTEGAKVESKAFGSVNNILSVPSMGTLVAYSD